MLELFGLFAWLFGAGIAGVAADGRGRTTGGFFLLALMFSWPLILLLVLVMPNLRSDELAQKRHVELLDAIKATA